MLFKCDSKFPLDAHLRRKMIIEIVILFTDRLQFYHLIIMIYKQLLRIGNLFKSLKAANMPQEMSSKRQQTQDLIWVEPRISAIKSLLFIILSPRNLLMFPRVLIQVI